MQTVEIKNIISKPANKENPFVKLLAQQRLIIGLAKEGKFGKGKNKAIKFVKPL